MSKEEHDKTIDKNVKKLDPHEKIGQNIDEDNTNIKQSTDDVKPGLDVAIDGVDAFDNQDETKDKVNPQTNIDESINEIHSDMEILKKFYDDLSDDLDEVENRLSGNARPNPNPRPTTPDNSAHGTPSQLAVQRKVENGAISKDVTSSKHGESSQSERDDAKADIQGYMNFLKAKKIIEKNKWELTHPKNKQSYQKQLNAENQHSSELNSNKLDKSDFSLQKKSGDGSTSGGNRNNNNIKLDADGSVDADGGVDSKNKPSFQDMMKHLQTQLSSLEKKTPDSLVSSDSVKDKNSAHASRKKTTRLGKPVSVRRRGKAQSQILNSEKEFPQPDDDDVLPLYEDTAELKPAVLSANQISANNKSKVYDIVDQGRDKIDIAAASPPWFTRIHGQPQLVIAGCVVVGLGLMLVVIYVINTLCKRRSIQSKGRKLYNKLLPTERKTLLKHKQKRYSLFDSGSSSEELTETESEDFTQNKA